jgi:uncharacterized membrane-anchored protein YjiN (DUF445 family)
VSAASAIGGSDAARQARLAMMKRRATMLLLGVGALFVVMVLWRPDGAWAGYVQAGAEAALVGGLADWFAVTALFRHPLGIPIPHTAIVKQRKDQFAATLGEFVQESFLTPESIVDRVRGAAVVERSARWLADPRHAQRAASELSAAMLAVMRTVGDDQFQRLLDDMVRSKVASTPLAPLAGRALTVLITDDRHGPVVDAALVGLDRYLATHDDELRLRLSRSSPWWLPGAVEDRIFNRLFESVSTTLHEMAADRSHPLRVAFDARIRTLADELRQSPELRRRGEEIKFELLEQPELRSWIGGLWQSWRADFETQAADASSPLRRRMTSELAAAGERLVADRALIARLQTTVDDALRHVAQHFHGEIASMITGTVERWDTEETSRRVELLLGPDLQYIRVNGTVVGCLAGLALHAVAQVF